MFTVAIIILGVLLIFLIAVASHIGKILKELEALSREQHIQNIDIIRLTKANSEMKNMLLQHIEILKYLCEQDPMIGKVRIPYTGPIGEA